ncbi:MAG: hypothetical protein JO247_14220 [Chloroflexi bacterium]|nr:hypothetical protein [Chloroflexota bacterium]
MTGHDPGTPQLRLPRTSQWRRLLPAEGSVLVPPGAAVEPDSIVAEGKAPVPPVAIDLGQAKSLVEVGQDIQAGDLLARRKKMLGRGAEVHAPVAGKIVRQVGTELLLAPPPRTVQLPAQLPGTIAAVRNGWGVDVEGCFALVRGCWTTGGELHGVLGEDIAIVVEPLLAARLESMLGQGIRGVIGPSWAGAASASPLPLFLTEPAPGTPMATPIAQALQQHLGARAAIQAGPRPLMGIFVKDHGQQQRFGPGAWVRAADGRAGRLVSQGDKPRFFASGVRTLPAEVDFGDKTELLPLDSLEWIA